MKQMPNRPVIKKMCFSPISLLWSYCLLETDSSYTYIHTYIQIAFGKWTRFYIKNEARWKHNIFKETWRNIVKTTNNMHKNTLYWEQLMFESFLEGIQWWWISDRDGKRVLYLWCSDGKCLIWSCLEAANCIMLKQSEAERRPGRAGQWRRRMDVKYGGASPWIHL